VIGVEPEDFTSLDLELSPKVQEAMPRIIQEVLKELDKYGISYSKK
jgi:Ni,Fe-hydrogenase maturation factor